jgi:flagellin-like protein
MYILNKHFNNRAVSQVIAALLLIAIAVAAAVLVYVFSIGLLGSLQGSGGQQMKEQVILEAYNWGNLASLVLNLRNVGTAGVTMASMYVNGTVRTATGCPTLAAQATCVMTLTISPAATTGVSYVIKVRTIDGAVFSYSAIAGQAS